MFSKSELSKITIYTCAVLTLLFTNRLQASVYATEPHPECNRIAISVVLIGESGGKTVHLTEQEFASLYRIAKPRHKKYIYDKTDTQITDRVFLRLMLNTLPFCYRLGEMHNYKNLPDAEIEQIYFDGIVAADKSAQRETESQVKLINNQNFDQKTKVLYQAKVISGNKDQLDNIAVVNSFGDTVIDEAKLDLSSFQTELLEATECPLSPHQLHINEDGTFSYCVSYEIKPLTYKKVSFWQLSIPRTILNDDYDSKYDNDIMKKMLEMSTSGSHPTEFKDLHWTYSTIYLLNPEYTRLDKHWNVKMKAYSSLPSVESVLLTSKYDVLCENEYIPPIAMPQHPEITLIYVDKIEASNDNSSWVMHKLQKLGFMTDYYEQVYVQFLINQLSKNLQLITIHSQDAIDNAMAQA